MNTREVATEYRLVSWAQVLQERVTGKESIKDFCRRKGISRNTYFYWQRKLREAACAELAARTQREVAVTEGSLVPSGWAVCQSAEPVVDSKAVTIEIGGFRIAAEADTDPEVLAKVCRVLKSLC